MAPLSMKRCISRCRCSYGVNVSMQASATDKLSTWLLNISITITLMEKMTHLKICQVGHLTQGSGQNGRNPITCKTLLKRAAEIPQAYSMDDASIIGLFSQANAQSHVQYLRVPVPSVQASCERVCADLALNPGLPMYTLLPTLKTERLATDSDRPTANLIFCTVRPAIFYRPFSPLLLGHLAPHDIISLKQPLSL